MPEGVGYGPQFVVAASKNINVIGAFCYAYSGLLQASDTNFHTVLEFKTGNYTLVGRINISGMIDDTNFGQGKSAVGRVSLNGVAQSMLRCGSGLTSDQPAQAWQDFVIPPYTEVLGELGASEADANSYSSMILSGRIYK